MSLLKTVSGSVTFAVLWAILATVSPTTTYHLAPAIVAGVGPVLAPHRRDVAVAATLAVALVATAALSVSGVLAGETLLWTGGAALEAVVAAVAGAVVSWSVSRSPVFRPVDD